MPYFLPNPSSNELPLYTWAAFPRCPYVEDLSVTVQFAGIQVFVVAWNQVEYTANFYIAVAGWTNWPWKGLLVVVEGSVYIICQSIVVYKLQKRQDDTLVSRFVQPRLAYQLTHYSSSVWSSEFPLQVRTNAIMTSANDLFLLSWMQFDDFFREKTVRVSLRKLLHSGFPVIKKPWNRTLLSNQSILF